MADRGAREPTGWAYLQLVTAVPGVSVGPRQAVLLQFGLFEAVAVALSARYGLWSALPLATAAIAVSAAGSAMMAAIDGRIRALSPPEPYRRTLFDSSADVVMGLVAFVLLVTVLLLGARRPDGGLLVAVLGEPLPALAVAFGLFVAWDVAYRIGTAWWVSITGLWRTLGFGPPIDGPTRRAYVRIELLVMAFAAVQLVLVPFLLPYGVLAAVVAGHVGAVFAASGISVALLGRA